MPFTFTPGAGLEMELDPRRVLAFLQRECLAADLELGRALAVELDRERRLHHRAVDATMLLGGPMSSEAMTCPPCFST
jgi:hypothetical protein